MAYSKQTWDTISYVNPTRMNHIEDGIAGIKDATILDLAPTTDETIASLIGRLRQTTGMLSNEYYQYYKLRLRPSSATQNRNLIFNCTKFVANSQIEFTASRLTGDGIVFYRLAITTSEVSLSQVVVNTSGVTATEIGTNEAQSDGVRVMGLNNNE